MGNLNWMVLLGGVVELIISLFVGIAFIFVAFKFFMKINTELDEEAELLKKNTAVGILMAAVVFAVAYQMIAPVENAYQLFSLILRESDATFLTYLSGIGLMILHLLIAGLVSLFGIFIGMKTFMWLSRHIDEMKEIKENNVAIALVIGATIIGITLVLKPGLTTILDALIPFPTRVIGL